MSKYGDYCVGTDLDDITPLSIVCDITRRSEKVLALYKTLESSEKTNS